MVGTAIAVVAKSKQRNVKTTAYVPVGVTTLVMKPGAVVVAAMSAAVAVVMARPTAVVVVVQTVFVAVAVEIRHTTVAMGSGKVSSRLRLSKCQLLAATNPELVVSMSAVGLVGTITVVIIAVET